MRPGLLFSTFWRELPQPCAVEHPHTEVDLLLVHHEQLDELGVRPDDALDMRHQTSQVGVVERSGIDVAFRVLTATPTRVTAGGLAERADPADSAGTEASPQGRRLQPLAQFFGSGSIIRLDGDHDVGNMTHARIQPTRSSSCY